VRGEKGSEETEQASIEIKDNSVEILSCAKHGPDEKKYVMSP